jgi:hypothetical protein
LVPERSTHKLKHLGHHKYILDGVVTPVTSPKIFSGHCQTNEVGDFDVVFPVHFTYSAHVVCSSNNGQPGVQMLAEPTSVTLVGFHVSTLYNNAKTGPVGVDWIAVGY